MRKESSLRIYVEICELTQRLSLLYSQATAAESCRCLKAVGMRMCRFCQTLPEKKGWTCSFPRTVDSRSGFGQGSSTRSRPPHNHQENSWSWLTFLPNVHHSSYWASADSAVWNGHSPPRQPQSQTVYCYLKFRPSKDARCWMIVGWLWKPVRGTSGCEKFSCPPLHHPSAACWTWESGNEMSDLAGATETRKVKQNM